MSLTILSVLTSTWTLGVWLVACEIRRRRLSLTRAHIDKRHVVQTDRSRWLAVLILAGREQNFSRRLEQFASWGRAHNLRVAVAIAFKDEAFNEVANWTRLQTPSVDRVELIVSSSHSRNRKVCQLAAITEWGAHHGYCFILNLDSDVVFSSVVPNAFFLAFADPALAAAWQPFGAATSCTTLAAAFETAILNSSQHAMPLLARIDRNILAGKIFAYRLDAVAGLGGWMQFAHLLGEDLAFARALRRGAQPFRVLRPVAQASRSNTTLSSLWERMVRWLGVIREQRPWLLAAYPLMFFYTGPLAICWTILICNQCSLWLCMFGLLVTIYSRLSIAYEAKRATEANTAFLLLIRDSMLSDVFLAAVWLRILAGRARRWRGHPV